MALVQRGPGSNVELPVLLAGNQDSAPGSTVLGLCAWLLSVCVCCNLLQAHIYACHVPAVLLASPIWACVAKPRPLFPENPAFLQLHLKLLESKPHWWELVSAVSTVLALSSYWPNSHSQLSTPRHTTPCKPCLPDELRVWHTCPPQGAETRLTHQTRN